MLSGRILFAVHKGTYVVKFLGEVRVPLCMCLENFLDKMFHDDGLRGVLIDLSETFAIDSTALGLIAKISVFMRDKLHKRPVILSTNPDITRVLESMGFDRVFLMLNKAVYSTEEWSELAFEEASQEEMTKNVIESHQVLMGMNEKNKETFQDLVTALELERSCK